MTEMTEVAIPANISSKSDSDLDVWIENHIKKGVTDTDLYKGLVAEKTRRREKRAERQSAGLQIETTIKQLLIFAKAKAFVSYSEIADANGISWNNAFRPMPLHLDAVLAECAKRGWPPLTAICVKRQNVKTGALEGDSLTGFIAGVERAFGQTIAAPNIYLKQAQRDCFTWAESQ